MNKRRKGPRAQDPTEQKVKLDSASEATSQYDAIQLNPKVVQPMEAEEAPPFEMYVHTTLELSKQKMTLTD